MRGLHLKNAHILKLFRDQFQSLSCVFLFASVMEFCCYLYHVISLAG